MKVKIGDTIYNSKDIAIVVTLDQTEKDYLREQAKVNPGMLKYAAFPAGTFANEKDAVDWMSNDGDGYRLDSR